MMTVGTRLGPYEITGSLGAGGMGEVYRARDAKLNRDVALKVLPESLAGDPDRLARFRREAQVLAALNHPNIAHIHGFEDSGTTHALVMELVEGPTLADRIAQGPIPLDEALPIARQIAEALESAHEQGIIHRDLKPANIKVRPDGTVKVLDFGLAKALDPATSSGADVMNSPTLTAHATQMGMILGTAAYMAPEQARGKPVDRRADIWAFGVVLYEMLTGRRAFDGDDVSITLASVLKEDVSWTALPGDIPASVRRLLRRCLEKDPKRRLSAIGDARLELEEALTAPPAEGTTAVVGRRRGMTSNRVAWSVAVGLLLVCASLAAMLIMGRTLPHRPSISFEVSPPAGGTSLQIALSPDGRYLVAPVAGGSTLWVRPLDQLAGRLLTGTNSPRFPFWSPDSRFIAFFSEGKLKKIDLSGAPPQTLSDAPNGLGGTWNRDGVIVFAPVSGPLFRLPAAGGSPAPVTTLDVSRREIAHEHPSFLPDGRHFLYLAVSSRADESAIYVGQLDSTERTRLVSSVAKAVFAPPGYLLFMRRGTGVPGESTLMAQRFDASRLELVGDSFPTVDHVGVNEANGVAGFTVSDDGILAHRSSVSSASTPLTRLTWFDRTGKRLMDVGDAGRYRNPRLSPDGARIVVETREGVPSNTDLAVLDSRGVASRFTSDPADDSSAVWSPDGTRIAWRNGGFGGNPGELRHLFQKASSNIGREEKLPLDNGPWVIDAWLPDGSALLFHDGTTLGATSPGFQLLPLTGIGGSRMIGDTRSLVTHGRISPDGHWLAFTALDLGKTEIYIQNFPTPTGRWRVSPGGGAMPLWRRDGKELFYIAPDGKLMAVSVKLSDTAEPGTPVALFATQMERAGVQMGGFWHQYDVSHDGTRFLVNTLVDAAAATASPQSMPITVIVNWAAALKK